MIVVIGPQAASYVQSLTSYDLQTLTFGTSAYIPIEGFNLHVARGGYTGEDGFEVRITYAKSGSRLMQSARFPFPRLRHWMLQRC